MRTFLVGLLGIIFIYMGLSIVVNRMDNLQDFKDSKGVTNIVNGKIIAYEENSDFYEFVVRYNFNGKTYGLRSQTKEALGANVTVGVNKDTPTSAFLYENNILTAYLDYTMIIFFEMLGIFCLLITYKNINLKEKN